MTMTDDPISSRKTIPYSWGLLDSEDGRPDFDSVLLPNPYASMFMEDVSYDVFPLQRRLNCGPIKVKVHPDDGVTRGLVTRSISRSWNGDIASAVGDFCRACAQTLVMYSSAAYEIVYNGNWNEGTMRAFELDSVHPLSLVIDGNQLYQRVPMQVADDQNLPQRVSLIRDNIVRIEPSAGVRSALDRVRQWTQRLPTMTLAPKFFMNQTGPENGDWGYDIKEFHRTQIEALAEATSGTGWLARNMLNEFCNEYYTFYRFLKFERFKAQIRTCILSGLNTALEIVGRKTNTAISLKVEGLPGVSDVDDVIAELRSGTSTFDEIVTKATFHKQANS